MAATRLSLSMDESVVERARRLADARNTSYLGFLCRSYALWSSRIPLWMGCLR